MSDEEYMGVIQISNCTCTQSFNCGRFTVSEQLCAVKNAMSLTHPPSISQSPYWLISRTGTSAYAEEYLTMIIMFLCTNLLQILFKQSSFYRVTACNATHGIVVAILSTCPSVRLSDACIVTKLNDALQIF